MFKVNNKNTRTTSLTFFFIVKFEHKSHISRDSIIDSDQVNVRREACSNFINTRQARQKSKSLLCDHLAYSFTLSWAVLKY